VLYTQHGKDKCRVMGKGCGRVTGATAEIQIVLQEEVQHIGGMAGSVHEEATLACT
jgi:hypothetical protein